MQCSVLPIQVTRVVTLHAPLSLRGPYPLTPKKLGYVSLGKAVLSIVVPSPGLLWAPCRGDLLDSEVTLDIPSREEREGVDSGKARPQVISYQFRLTGPKQTFKLQTRGTNTKWAGGLGNRSEALWLEGVCMIMHEPVGRPFCAGSLSLGELSS